MKCHNMKRSICTIWPSVLLFCCYFVLLLWYISPSLNTQNQNPSCNITHIQVTVQQSSILCEAMAANIVALGSKMRWLVNSLRDVIKFFWFLFLYETQNNSMWQYKKIIWLWEGSKHSILNFCIVTMMLLLSCTGFNCTMKLMWGRKVYQEVHI